MERFFPTSWDARLKWNTVFALAVVAVVTVMMALTFGSADGAARDNVAMKVALAFYAVGMWIAIAWSMLYSPKSYRITDTGLWIERGVRPKRIPLDSIVSVEPLEKAAMRRTWRVVGIGGLFCWNGWFRNKVLGDFSMSATRSDRLVLIRTGKERIVLTPDSPDEFVATLSGRLTEADRA